jgi:DNA polymerase-3 subunit delta
MIRSILGPNAFLAKRCLSELLSGVDASSIERLEGVDVEIKSLANLLQAQSLFTNPTVVLSNISEQKALLDDMIELIDSLSDEVELIIYEPAIDKRSKFYKFLLKNTECSEFKNLDGNDLAQWLVKEAEARGGKIDRASAWYLVERVGEDQWQLSNELDKLLLSEAVISKQLIDDVVEQTPNESIFKLLDAVLAGNQKLALECFDNLKAQKLDANYIMSMLAWQMHILTTVVYAGTRTPEQVAKETKLSPFVVKKTAQVAKNTSKARLRTMLEMMVKLDADLKSKPIDGDEAMKQLLIKLSI